ncbi:hypothetical protein JXB02_04985, partial [Candidatus Woesearchaeota archaeon]|nr:hypothetical protein [Candidatus Woesearchaeota archaeon]
TSCYENCTQNRLPGDGWPGADASAYGDWVLSSIDSYDQNLSSGAVATEARVDFNSTAWWNATAQLPGAVTFTYDLGAADVGGCPGAAWISSQTGSATLAAAGQQLSRAVGAYADCVEDLDCGFADWQATVCNATIGAPDTAVCTFTNIINDWTGDLLVTVATTPPNATDSDWGPCVNCTNVTLVRQDDSTTVRFLDVADVVYLTEGGWIDNGTCSDYGYYQLWKTEGVTFSNIGGIDMEGCAWLVDVPPGNYSIYTFGVVNVSLAGNHTQAHIYASCNNPPSPASGFTPALFHDLTTNVSWNEGVDEEGETVSSWLCVATSAADRQNGVCDAVAFVERADPWYRFQAGDLAHLGTNRTYYVRIFEYANMTNSTAYDVAFNLSNFRPYASAVATGPAGAIYNTTLWCNYTFTDADGDLENGTVDTYLWFLQDEGAGGFSVLSGETGKTLAGAFDKGDVVVCSALVYDEWELAAAGYANGTALTIANGAPATTQPSITPAAPLTMQNLTCAYTYSDPDGDSESGTLHAWYRNGVEEPAATGAVLDRSFTARGESWICQVTPSDGTSFGAPKNASAVIIQNTPASLNVIGTVPYEPQFNGMTYLYANVTDDDTPADVVWVNFTLIAPNLTHVIDNLNGSRAAEIWSSIVVTTSRLGVWNYTVTASDGLSVSQASANFTVRDSDYPQITLYSPPDDELWTGKHTVPFGFSAYDPSLNLSVCRLIINGTQYNSISDPDEYVAYNLTAYLENSTWAWYINCTDTFGNSNRSATRLFTMWSPPDEYIWVRNLGQTGFEETNQEFTSLRTVLLELAFNESATKCRYANENLNWTVWETCEESRYWLLTDVNGAKVVYYDVNHTDGFVHRMWDSIYLNKSGYGLDLTPPVGLIVVDDGNFTNDNASLHAYWYNASDRESELLNSPLLYQYRIRDQTSFTTVVGWTAAGTATEVTRTNLSLVENHTYVFDVLVRNSANLNMTASSDGIALDTAPPTIGFVLSPTHPLETVWYANGSPTLVWNGSDSVGRVDAYSYLIDRFSNITPDQVPEYGVNKSYTGLSDGSYYFHVRARDEAGNYGGAAHFRIRIDTTAPTTPRMEAPVQNATNASILFEWQASLDQHAGIAYYQLQVGNSSTFANSTLVYNSTAGNVTARSVRVPRSGTYYGRVRAVDLAGNPSLWSTQIGEIIDTTPPIIIFKKPINIVVSRMVNLVLNTDETATCRYDGKRFDFTNSTYHQARVNLSVGDYVYNISCTNLALLTNSTLISFQVRLWEPTSVIVTAHPPYYTDGIVALEAIVENGTSSLGEIPVDWFAVLLNGSVVDDFTVIDNGDGNYTVLFRAPIESAGYSVMVEIRGVTDTVAIDVEDIYLTVSYDDAGVSGTPLDSIIYYETPSYAVGIASDSSRITKTSADGRMELSYNLLDGTSYLFLTRPAQNLRQKERYLKTRTFTELINPSFGYPLDKDYLVSAGLEFPDILVSGSQSISDGRYSLMIRNAGLDPDDNTVIELQII